MAKTRAQLPHLYYPKNMYQTRINNAQNFGGGGGGWNVVASSSAAGNFNTDAVTSGINTSGATLIVAACAAYEPAFATISDSKGNTWTKIAEQASDGFARLAIFYVDNPTVGSGHAFTNALQYPSIAVIALSGNAASPLDLSSIASGASASSITPTENNSLVIAACVRSIDSTLSIDSGFSIIESKPWVGFESIGVGLATLEQATAAAVDPTWTNAGSLAVSGVVSFKPA